ncbi:MAG: inositol monophosphatase family protein [Acidimicrobiales bacterium]|nr:inositol monophosphatase family protein [Actinomycetota bacterium]HAQ43643.1 inositol monophosphatase [Acidimicrobiaceae bacterium]
MTVVTDASELKQLLDLAVDFALRAGEVHHRRATGDVGSKSTATDPVTQVDREAEALIAEAIKEARPDDSILGEESTLIEGTSGFQWVIDPLDGTVNYLYNFPSYAVSIGIETAGEPVVGVVLDTAINHLFAAQRGGMATKNGEEIQVTSCSELPLALLGTGFAYEPSVREQQAKVAGSLLPKVRDIRRSGSCAVDLCSVAAGRLDAFYETGVNWWDVAAGIQIVRSAGGVATYEPDLKRVFASGPKLWDQLIHAVNQAEKGL